MRNLGALEGMIIGAIDGVHITADTPIDLTQWVAGMPWHWHPADLDRIKPLKLRDE